MELNCSLYVTAAVKHCRITVFRLEIRRMSAFAFENISLNRKIIVKSSIIRGQGPRGINYA